MVLSPKQLAITVMERHPVYHLMPPGAVRTYATLRYHSRHPSQSDVARLVNRLGGIPTRYLSTALVGARAVFRAGHDDLLADALHKLERRFPEAPAVHELWSDLYAFHGDYRTALGHAEHARTLQPSAPAATARVVRLGYQLLDRHDADRSAVAAMRRFPRTGEVLWAVCRHCSSAAQCQRLLDTWHEAVPERAGLPRAVRPLAMAAARASQLDVATNLYRQAMIQLAGGNRAPAPITETVLEGRHAHWAIEDLCQLLDSAGVPFFFAAGTALGLVREGRPLGADGDIDVGIADADWDRDALTALFRADPRFDLVTDHPLAHKIGVRHRAGSPVDVFRFYEQDGQVWHDAVFVRWHNSPFTVSRRDIGGRPVPLPDDVDTYLTENYADWRTPWPGFDAFTDDAPNVEVTWPDYHHLHLLRRAYKRFAAGDRHGTACELHRAGEEELAVRLGVSYLARLSDVEAPLGEPAAERARLAATHVTLARQARADGDHETAAHILETALRSGLWPYARLWSELRSLMRQPADFHRIRVLWRDSPRECHRHLSVLQAVARAASVAGAHTEARALLRKAIVLRARQVQRLRATVRRRVRAAQAKIPRPAPRRETFDNRAALALADLNSELDTLGVRSFLISGTLLGCVRDSGFIGWDKDIDVGFLTDEIAPADLEKAFDRSAQFDVRRLDFNSDRLRVNHTNGVMIDVFPHYRGPDGRVWHDGSATRWWNSPFGLTTVTFLGTTQLVPDPPERYLEENYGSDWRVPRPDFDARLDTPNVEVTDPELFLTLLFFALLEAMIADKPERRRRYASLLRQHGEGDWLRGL